MITSFIDMPATSDVRNMGCFRLLAKPVRKEDLLASVNAAIASARADAADVQGEECSFSDEQYARVPLDELIAEHPLEYPVFVRFKDGRFLKIAHTASELDRERLASLKAKGVFELWLRKDDFQNHLRFSKELAHQHDRLSTLPQDKRARILQHACEVAYENLRVVGLNQKSFELATGIFRTSLELLEGSSMGQAILEALEARGRTPYAHAVTCGMLCGMMTKVMGWFSRRNITSLTLGGLFHDIGIPDQHFELHYKERSAMTPEELSLFEEHPKHGVDKLQALPNIPEEVLSIIAQHHERADGTGFPTHLHRNEIFPMARAVTVVDEFCDRLLRSSASAPRPTPPQILGQMLSGGESPFDSSAILALSKIIAHPEIEEAKFQYTREANRLFRR
jgi:HD-GYP domain-containing protein (c-di-GMP phosphodiesterase class II)